MQSALRQLLLLVLMLLLLQLLLLLHGGGDDGGFEIADAHLIGERTVRRRDAAFATLHAAVAGGTAIADAVADGATVVWNKQE